MSTPFASVGPGGDWRRNAVVRRHDDHVMAMGFAEAAQLIVDSWTTSGPNDLLFEPLVYNLRHALELVLKSAIRVASRCLRDEGDDDPKLKKKAVDSWLAREAGHNLHKLASRLHRLLDRLDLDEIPKDHHRVLMSLHELDPTGETFRYSRVRGPGDTWVAATRPLLDGTKGQAHVDVVAMHDHFRSAFNIVSAGIMTVLELMLEYQADMRSQAGPA